MIEWERRQGRVFSTATDEPDARAYVQTKRLAQTRRALLDALVARRKQLDKSQGEIASLLNTTQSAISAIEQGRKDSRLWTLLRMAEALGCYIHFELKELPQDDVGTLGEELPEFVGNETHDSEPAGAQLTEGPLEAS